MDDPWGSPWATDDHSTIPTINLPAAPPPATLSSHSNSPRVSISANASPWQNDDDAWGGWNDARSGTSSPGWGRSPGLKPAMVRERDVSPGPWVGRKSEDPGVHPLVALEEEKKSSTLQPEAQVIWQRVESHENEKKVESKPGAGDREASVSEPGSSVRAQSPDISPPGTALRAEDRPEPTRSSSKVQELVDMYDGIAKRSISPAEPALVSPPPQKLRETTTDEDQDDERGDVVSSPTTEPQKGLNLGSLVEPTEPKSPDTTPIVANGWPEDDVPETLAVSTPPKSTTKRPQIAFTVDLSHLESLFPSIPLADVSPEPLPDTIIDDTFANISERKTWYRVSRFGSMRKHNHGNDENYIRMDWAHSAARDKSLRIVRRWMEEDSIAGRVSLGARRKGAAGGSMFNWDSKAEPVDVGELLGKRRGHERGGSKDSITSKGSKRDIVSPVGATFGWSSQTTSPTGPSFPMPFDPKPPGLTEAKGRPQSLIMPPQSVVKDKSGLAGPPKTRPASLVLPSTQAIDLPSIDQALVTSQAEGRGSQALSRTDGNAAGEDDDDDWGEMVSSPTVPSNNTFAAMNADAPLTAKPAAETVKSPSAASFGWSETHSLPMASPEQTKPAQGTDSKSNAPSFGWEDFEKPASAVQTAQAQSNVAAFEWDDWKSPVADVSKENPAPGSKPDALLGWDDPGNLQNTAKAALTNPQAGDAMFEWKDTGASPEKGVATPASQTAIDSHPTIQTSSDPPLPTSPTIASPLSPTSVPKPSQPPPRPQQIVNPKSHTRTPSQTKEDDGIVATILNGLPDLSYMLR